MTDKLQAYHEGTTPIGNTNRLWPLYGAGLENLGQDGQPIEVPAPTCGPDELLIRHDAIGLCFSDIKVIKQGPNHPRIGRDMVKEPVVLGHEVSLTVVGVGENLRDAVQGRRSLHRPGRDQRQRLQHGLRLPAAGRAVGLQRDRPAHPERRRRQLSDPGAAGDRLCRKRADRALGLRHRGLRPEISHRAESGRHGVDRRRPDRGRGQGAGNSSYTISAGFDAAVTPCRDCC